MDFTIDLLIYDGAIVAALMILSVFLRKKISFFQNFIVPAPVIAGIIGMVLGKYGFGVIKFSEQASSYSGYLFYFLFATLFLMKKENNNLKSLIKKSWSSVCLINAAYVGFYGVAAIIGTTLLCNLFPALSSKFGVLSATGFAGGHGSAAAIGKAFQATGFTQAVSVAQTFATIGLLCGIFGGVALIKLATKKHYTQLIKDASELNNDVKTGLIEESDRKVFSKESTHPMSIDSLTWHISLVVCATGLGMAFNKFVIKEIFPDIYLPDHIFTLLAGAVVFWILKMLKLNKYIENSTITHIGSSVTDLLIVFGVATINLNIVMDYWLPILLMCIAMLLLNLLFLLVISKKGFKDFWFERGIFIYGMCTGVAATGILLLRVVDPKYETTILEDIGISMIVMTPIDMAILAMTPIMFVANLGLLWGGILFVSAVVMILLSKLFYKKTTV